MPNYYPLVILYINTMNSNLIKLDSVVLVNLKYKTSSKHIVSGIIAKDGNIQYNIALNT